MYALIDAIFGDIENGTLIDDIYIYIYVNYRFGYINKCGPKELVENNLTLS